MNRYALRSITALAVAALAFTGIATTAAGAKTTPASFVGTYTIHLTSVQSPDFVKGTLTLNADGTAQITPGYWGDTSSWTSKHAELTITFSITAEPGNDATFTAKQKKNGNLARRAAPATWTIGGLLEFKWYAVKTS